MAVNMFIPQLLQISPTVRAGVAFLIQPNPFKDGNAKKKTSMNPTGQVFKTDESRHHVSLIMDVNAINRRQPRDDDRISFKDIAWHANQLLGTFDRSFDIATISTLFDSVVRGRCDMEDVAT